MTNKTRKIFRLNQTDVPQIVKVLCDSFFDYPVMRFVIDSAADYQHKLKILINFFVMARIFRQEVLLGIGDRANPDGIALISSSENSLNPPELKDLRERVWSELGIQSRSNYQKFSDISGQFQVNFPNLHLNMIGIKRSAQGMGLGRQLIEQVHLFSLKDSDSKGVTLSTEDPAKVPFYKYMGYDIIGEAVITPEIRTWSFFRPDFSDPAGHARRNRAGS